MDGGTATVGFADDAPQRAVLTGPATYVATIEVTVGSGDEVGVP
jgi:hypothetical protein